VPAPAPAKARPWASGLLLYSGREALRLLAEHGARRRGWRRLWLPDYFCQDVVAALSGCGLRLASYRDHPLRRAPDLPDARRGDAVLLVNYFGLRGPLPIARVEGVELVEDHTHDPDSAWARDSAADFCVASLRKTLPVPDGAALWSPRGHALPAAPPLSAQRRDVSATRLTAMVLKALYLQGHSAEKEAYRALADGAERALAAPGVSAMSPLARAVAAAHPVERWRRARSANHAALSSRLGDLGWATVLGPAPEGGVPYCCALALDSHARREGVRRRLVAERVYPAVLWPLEGARLRVHREARAAGGRILTLHCDGRYGLADMQRVADLVARAGGCAAPRRAARWLGA
jgi:hypothetical protein